MQANPLLSVVVPCFNEVATLEGVLKAVLGGPYQPVEVIVVDDSSNDGSTELLARISARKEPRLKVIYHPINKGKGAAIRTALSHARGEIMVIQDADLEYSPADYPRLLGPILNGHADVVFGTRFSGAHSHRVIYFWHRLANALLTFASNIFTNLNLTDMETCYKALHRSVYERITIEEDRFGIEPEVTAKIAKMKVRIFEVGISYNGRSYEEGKKIGLRDAFRAVFCIVKYNIFR